MAPPTYTHMIWCRVFTLTIHSASNLPNVRHAFPNRLQVQITLGEDPKNKLKCPADNRHGLSPVWNFHARYVFPVSKITVENLPVRVRLYSHSKMGDRYVGEANVFLRYLFDEAAIVEGTTRSADPADFPLIGKASETNGVLNMSYSFGEPFPMDAGELQRRACENDGAGVMLLGLASNVVSAIASAFGIVICRLDMVTRIHDLCFVGA